MHLLPVVCAVCLGLSIVLGAESQPEQPERTHARIGLIAEREALVAGREATLGVVFEMDEGWHIYWNGQNDSGLAPTLVWDVPEGVEVGPLQWPVPHRYELPGGLGVDHIYEGRIVALAPVTVSEGVEPGPLTVRVQGTWLCCQTMCVFEDGEATLQTRVAATDAQPSPAAGSDDIAKARGKLPRPLKDAPEGAVETRWEGDELAFKVRGAERLAFYPHGSSVYAESPLRQGVRKGDTLRMAFGSAGDDRTEVVGLLAVWRPQPGDTGGTGDPAGAPVSTPAGRGGAQEGSKRPPDETWIVRLAR